MGYNINVSVDVCTLKMELGHYITILHHSQETTDLNKPSSLN